MPLFEAGCLFYFVHFAYWQFPVLPVLFYLVLSCLVLSCLVLSYSVLSSTVLSLGTKKIHLILTETFIIFHPTTTIGMAPKVCDGSA